MVEAELNLFDAAVMLVFFLSTLLAFFRGFVREILSLGAWVGALMITFYAFPKVNEMLEPAIAKEMVRNFISALGTYITALVSISIINSVIMRYVKEGSDVGMLDNFLGLLFGILRGGFVVSLGFWVMSLFFIDPESYPEWVQTAQTRELVESGAQILAKLAPGYLDDLKNVKDRVEDNDEEEDSAPDGKDSGYSSGQRKALDRFIQSTSPFNDDEESDYAPPGFR